MKSKPSWYGYLYLVKNGDLYKIGYTNYRLHRRLAQLRTAAPLLELIHSIRTPFFKQIEHQLHVKFGSRRIGGEWFQLFPEDIAYIKSLDKDGFSPEERKLRGLLDQMPEPDPAIHAFLNEILG
jgi:hypothetical protein